MVIATDNTGGRCVILRPSLRSALDLISVVVVGVVLVGAGLGCYILADKYGVPDTWVLFASLGVVSIVVIGRSVRSMFGHPLFIPYFAVWVVVQTAGTAVAFKDYGGIIAIPVALFLLFMGYFVTFQIFGVPPDRKPNGKGKTQETDTTPGENEG